MFVPVGLDQWLGSIDCVSIFDIQFSISGTIKFNVPKEQIVLVYVIDGELQFSEIKKIASKGQIVFFDKRSDAINLTSISSYGSYLILAGKPLNEPIARHGPFVANTAEEIKQAVIDYQTGKMGELA